MTVVLREHPAVAEGPPAADHLEFLATFCNGLAGLEKLDLVLTTALDALSGHLAVECAAIYLFDHNGNELPCRASVGPKDILGITLQPWEGLVGRCIWRNALEVIDDPAELRDHKRTELKGRVETLRTVLCAPISTDTQPLGVIELINPRSGSFSRNDRRLVRTAAGMLALAVAKGRIAADLEEHVEVDKDLEMAADIQRSLLPPTDLSGLPVYGFNRAARRVSGDFFDFFEAQDGSIPFALGDVSGKGIKAAFLMAKTVSLFRCLAKAVVSPSALLAIINREIKETSTHGMFVTMVVGRYDPWTGVLRFANAGHLPPLLRRPDRTYQAFPAEAPPLGVLSEVTFKNTELRLEGDEFYVFSDGLTEYRYGDDEELGFDGLIQLLEASAEDPLRDRLYNLLSELDKAGWESRDDLTILALEDKPKGGARE